MRSDTLMAELGTLTIPSKQTQQHVQHIFRFLEIQFVLPFNSQECLELKKINKQQLVSFGCQLFCFFPWVGLAPCTPWGTEGALTLTFIGITF